jgi:uncharacterized membrane protein YphA (DoxX/SURF4 family)
MTSGNASRGPALNYVLWALQGLLALLFLFAGAMKFIMPIAEMTKQMPLPAWFLYFIGVAEILGGLGLVLPSALRIQPGLTPLAAAGLVIIMIGATVISAQTAGAKGAILPFVVLLLTAYVAYGRWRLWPIAAKG